MEFAIQPDILKPRASAVAVHVSAARAEGITFIGLCCSLLEGFLPVQGITCGSKNCGHGRICQAITSVYSGEHIIFS